MDPDQPPPSNPRKVRFQPKVPRRKTTPTDPKIEVSNDDDATTGDEKAAQSLLRRVSKHLGKQGPKVEKKSSVQVAFGHGAGSPPSLRTYGIPREGNNTKSNALGLTDSSADDEQMPFSLPSTAKSDGSSGSSINAVDALCHKKRKDYREPWDYRNPNSPITLPLRRPNSGDPELLDQAEFGDVATNLEYNENTINPAAELGLLEENDKPQMLFFQLPANLPFVKQSTVANVKGTTDSSKPSESSGALAIPKGKDRADDSKPSTVKGKEIVSSSKPSAVKGKEKVGVSKPSALKGKEIVIGSMPSAENENEIVGSSMPLEMGNASKKCSSLEELPGGYMGKMLVYKSGAIKWKLGEVIFDVSPGLTCVCAQDVVAINTVDQNCCVLGDLSKRAVVTPDIDSGLEQLLINLD